MGKVNRLPKLNPKKVATPGSVNLADNVKRKKTKMNKKKFPKLPSERNTNDGVKLIDFSRASNYRHTYDQGDMEQAIAAVKSKEYSVRQAAERFGVPKSTLQSRAQDKTTDRLGRPTVLTQVEEKLLVQRLVLMGEWAFPLTKSEIRHVVKSYLDKMSRVTRFKDNLPQLQFVNGFLKRHPELTVRSANLIKRSRGRLSPNIVNDFFNLFEVTAADVEPTHVFNYDETNLTNNPGAQKAVFKRGQKYAEKIQDATKTSVSVMFCASASGNLLPPYVVYQGKNLYDDWCVGGVKDSVYACTSSGWFDSWTFADWFKRSFLKKTRHLVGKKVLVGDNLASHLSEEVISLCRENDISFVCFPPNSTHMMQPLDVGFFAQMKRAWRNILQRKADANENFNALRKVDFPSHLKELISELNPADHLPRAFEKCGISPINRMKVIERLPTVASSEAVAENLDRSFLEKLQARRYGENKRAPRPKGKKIPAGASYTDDADASDSNVDDEDVDDVDQSMVSSADEDEVESDDDGNDGDENDGELPDPHAFQQKYVVALYEGEWFLAEVCKDQKHVSAGYTKLSFMSIRGYNKFIWAKPDILDTVNEDILLKNVAPIPVTQRGHLGLTEKDLKFVFSKMVVLLLIIFLRNFSSKVVNRKNFYLFT